MKAFMTHKNYSINKMCCIDFSAIKMIDSKKTRLTILKSA